jgi:hypothetical protein
MARIISCTAAIWGLDHENFGANEERTISVSGTVILDKLEAPQTLIAREMRWGGECRAELEIIAVLLDSDRVRLQCKGKLFEGDNEGTTDLEDEKYLEVLVPRGKSESRHIDLINALAEGADRATIDFTVTNNILEED